MKMLLNWGASALALVALGCSSSGADDEARVELLTWWKQPSELDAIHAAIDVHRLGHPDVQIKVHTSDAARSCLDAALPNATRSFKTNGRDAMLALARTGAALACLASIVGDRTPDLQRIALFPTPTAPKLWLGVHLDTRETPRVKAVVTHLVTSLRDLSASLSPSD